MRAGEASLNQVEGANIMISRVKYRPLVNLNFKLFSFRTKIDLFGGQRLGIFTDTDKLKDAEPINQTWERLSQKELKKAVTHPPKNAFEEMILWTEQGKMWKFPIDNEQGKYYQ